MECVVVSKTFALTIQNIWNCALHKIYVSGMALNTVVFTGCLQGWGQDITFGGGLWPRSWWVRERDCASLYRGSGVGVPSGGPGGRAPRWGAGPPLGGKRAKTPLKAM